MEIHDEAPSMKTESNGFFPDFPIDLNLSNVRLYDDETGSFKLYNLMFGNNGTYIISKCKTDGTSCYSNIGCDRAPFEIKSDNDKKTVTINDTLFWVKDIEDYNRLIHYYEKCNMLSHEKKSNEFSSIISEKNKYIDRLYDATVNFINILPKELFYDRDNYQAFERLSIVLDTYSEFYYDTYGNSDDIILNRLRTDKNYYNYISSYGNKFKQFANILQSKSMYSANFSIPIAWLILKENSIKYFSNQWEIKYGSLINCDIKSATYSEYIKNYCICPDISHKDVYTVSLLTYFLMGNKKLENNNNYLECNATVINLVLKQLNNIEENQLSQYLFSPIENGNKAYSIEDIDLMNGLEFENFVSVIFKKMGYDTELTKQSGDQGIDVIATKGVTKIGIQAKCYSNTVGNSAIQEATAGKQFYNCSKIMVVTNNFFTSSAQQLALSNGVILWDRNMLKTKLSELY